MSTTTATATASVDELETQHKKALKSLDGEKRAAIKKAKALKGKKGKEALAAVETEFAAKLQALEEQHKQALLSTISASASATGSATATATATGSATADETPGPSEQQQQQQTQEQQQPQTQPPQLSEKERKLEKARRKKEKQRQKELANQQELEEIAANAGPNMRHVEMEQIQTTQLDPLQLTIAEVAADGHCLYRAVAAQTQQDYRQVRSLCAETLQAHPDEFAPFCEFTDKIQSFDDYVQQVRDSAEWGGHLELRALSRALKRPIAVYSIREPLHIQEENDTQTETETDKDTDNPIRLSYHHHYYALGEHYNQVVLKSQEGDE